MATLKAIYREGFNYKKAGVLLTSLIPKSSVQQSLFDCADRAKENKLMSVMDEIK